MLHILNGDSTRQSLEPSGVPGPFAVWADVLYEGQVPPLTVPPERWREIRSRAIANAGWASYDDALQTIARWEAPIERFADHDEVVIWCEHDLFDQLLLIHHLAWFAARDPGRTALSLICIGSFPGKPAFKGLGELQPAQLASLFPTRSRITARQLELGERAFAAFAGPDPRAIERLLATEDTSALPFLAPALARLLREYPSTRNGLSRTEEQMLAILAASGPLPTRELWRAMHGRESAYYVTDVTLRDLIAADSAQPGLLTSTPAVNGREWDATLAITPFGRQLLDGRDDLLRARGGIDRWIGGVHLQGAEPEWRWDESSERLVQRTSSERAKDRESARP